MANYMGVKAVQRNGQRIIGILGGKGPMATAQLFQYIINNTPAATEEEHIRILIDNHPAIPKPALAALGQGPDPIPALKESAQLLESMGADFIVIPCNSAHIFLNQVKATVRIPLISIISETVSAVRKSRGKRIGLLGTPALIGSQLYQSEMLAVGLEPVIPPKGVIQDLMESILLFKNHGERKSLEAEMEKIIKEFSKENLDGFIAGCTEIPVVLKDKSLLLTQFDTLEILAKSAVREALSKLHSNHENL